jgi:hypothetical protein
MRSPIGVPATPGKVWLLKKALYGLKQAALEWYRTLHAHIISLGYKQSGYDPCLYTHDKDHFILVYVDDLLVFALRETVEKRKKEIAGRYEMRDIGEAHWFLQMEIIWDREARTITISQKQYVTRILERFGMENSKPAKTPMTANLKLPKLKSPEINPQIYQSMLGSLMYAVISTRPDICFAVGYLAQHAIAPGEEHLIALKRVLRYLNRT